MHSRFLARLGLAVACVPPAAAQITQRMSSAPGGVDSDHWSGVHSISISADGRYVVFDSEASNLVAGDTNGVSDIFVYDRFQGSTERVSVNTGGYEANGPSYAASISADGRFVAFDSYAWNLVLGDTNNAVDVFVRDRWPGETRRVSLDSEGNQTIFDSWRPALSADGLYVGFESDSTNIVPEDTNISRDVFIRDLGTGVIRLVSIATFGQKGEGDSRNCAVSADGRFVAFQTRAANLDPDDGDRQDDVYVRDLALETTEWISRPPDIFESSFAADPAISADGRWVAFTSALAFDVGDTNGVEDILLFDRLNLTMERVSVDPGGAPADGPSARASLSADGRFVAFWSAATNLVPGDTNGVSDVFLRDRLLGTTERVSVDSNGAEADGACWAVCTTGDARYVALSSIASNLVAGDQNGRFDVFLRDRAATGFTSLCEPGVNGVNPCPCDNPPAGPASGCDNSIGSGGAKLMASGVAYLSMDSLVFTTSGEKPTATSVLMQGTATLSAGAVYGQGLRCTGGTLKRLYTKAASAGSITAPDFGAGDASISSRSAARGSPIPAGENRWYLVFYRDPIVLGGCPASSTFNATQTGKVTWWP